MQFYKTKKMTNNRRYYLHRKVKTIDGLILKVKLKTMYVDINDNPERYLKNKYVFALVCAGYSLQAIIIK